MRSLTRFFFLLVSISLIALLVRHYVLAIYYIPSPSMAPTINSGDWVVVTKPQILNRKTPYRNEVWLFNFFDHGQKSSQTLVKRFCALPGDTVMFCDGKLFVNGTKNEYVKLSEGVLSAGSTPIAGPQIFPHDTSMVQWSAVNFGPLYVPSKGSTIQLSRLNILIYRQLILNETPDMIFDSRGVVFIDDSLQTSYTFKENYYFVCGDNLSLSQDSRHWGLVSESLLIGRAELILFPMRHFCKNFKRCFNLIA